MISIRAETEHDPFERYKMPKPEVQITIKGKFSTTMFLNIDSIAQSLHTPVECLSKYLGCVLCTQATWQKKRGLSLKGTFNIIELTKHIRAYCEKYVLCKNCTVPELNFRVKKKSMQTICRACGASGMCDLDDRIYKTMQACIVNTVVP